MSRSAAYPKYDESAEKREISGFSRYGGILCITLSLFPGEAWTVVTLLFPSLRIHRWQGLCKKIIQENTTAAPDMAPIIDNQLCRESRCDDRLCAIVGSLFIKNFGSPVVVASAVGGIVSVDGKENRLVSVLWKLVIETNVISALVNGSSSSWPVVATAAAFASYILLVVIDSSG